MVFSSFSVPHDSTLSTKTFILLEWKFTPNKNLNITKPKTRRKRSGKKWLVVHWKEIALQVMGQPMWDKCVICTWISLYTISIMRLDSQRTKKPELQFGVVEVFYWSFNLQDDLARLSFALSQMCCLYKILTKATTPTIEKELTFFIKKPYSFIVPFLYRFFSASTEQNMKHTTFKPVLNWASTFVIAFGTTRTFIRLLLGFSVH